MSLSVNEIEMEILTLSEQEQLKLIDFMESLKIKFHKNSANSEAPNTLRKIGLFKGQIKMRDDFNDPFDYTKWQRDLWANQSLEELSQAAMVHWQTQEK